MNFLRWRTAAAHLRHPAMTVRVKHQRHCARGEQYSCLMFQRVTLLSVKNRAGVTACCCARARQAERLQQRCAQAAPSVPAAPLLNTAACHSTVLTKTGCRPGRRLARSPDTAHRPSPHMTGLACQAGDTALMGAPEGLYAPPVPSSPHADTDTGLPQPKQCKHPARDMDRPCRPAQLTPRDSLRAQPTGRHRIMLRLANGSASAQTAPMLTGSAHTLARSMRAPRAAHAPGGA